MIHVNDLLFLFGNVITPVQPEVSGTEGDNITLSCNYSSAVSLQWYRQYPNSAPEFLLTVLHRTGKVSQTSKIVDLDPRFSGKVTEKKTHVDLEISSVKMKDSALYYCALEPTVTGNTTTLYKNLTYVTHPVGSLLIIQEISADICLCYNLLKNIYHILIYNLWYFSVEPIELYLRMHVVYTSNQKKENNVKVAQTYLQLYFKINMRNKCYS
uniref:T-cell receptor alpha/delta variable 29.0 n=1 Tax=Cyprinus carpio TaxID=7962 RepID=A0A8C1UDC4_CYPCA